MPERRAGDAAGNEHRAHSGDRDLTVRGADKRRAVLLFRRRYR